MLSLLQTQFSPFTQNALHDKPKSFKLLLQNFQQKMLDQLFIPMWNNNLFFLWLGKNPTDEYLDAMMVEAPGPINFTMFLTLFGERLQGTDPEDVIKNAFGCFDEDNTGFIHEERLRELLISMGDRFTDEDVSILSLKRTDKAFAISKDLIVNDNCLL